MKTGKPRGRPRKSPTKNTSKQPIAKNMKKKEVSIEENFLLAQAEKLSLFETKNVQVNSVCASRADGRPRLMKKFRPPLSKSKLAASKQLEDSNPVLCKSSEQAVVSTELPFEKISPKKSTETQAESLEVLTFPEVLLIPDENANICVEKPKEATTKSSVEKVTVVSSKRKLSKSSSEAPPPKKAAPSIPTTPVEIAKFYLINKWLNSKQEGWCVKIRASLKKMLKKEALISKYKCMEKSCSYTTSSSRNFDKHLTVHEESMNKNEFLFNCPYCFFKGKTKITLIEHYDSYHKNDLYQCGLCFYRCADAMVCWEHGKTCHSMEKDPLIYEGPPNAFDDSVRNRMRLERKREKFVKSLRCSTCKFDFYLLNHYNKHMDSHREKEADKELVISDLEILRRRLINNKVGNYQCLHCEFGTQQRSEFRSHMQNHPTERLLACKRISLLSEIDPHSIESAPISELPKIKGVNPVKFDMSTVNAMRNAENIQNIS